MNFTEQEATHNMKLKGLVSRSRQKLDPPPAPPPPPGIGWTPPDPARKPNEQDARMAGAEALANVARPKPPTYGSVRVGG